LYFLAFINTVLSCAKYFSVIQIEYTKEYKQISMRDKQKRKKRTTQTAKREKKTRLSNTRQNRI